MRQFLFSMIRLYDNMLVNTSAVYDILDQILKTHFLKIYCIDFAKMYAYVKVCLYRVLLHNANQRNHSTVSW